MENDSDLGKCQEESPFDKEDFDAIRHVNSLFPDEESLSNLDPFIKSLSVKIRHIDGEILAAVRQQSSSGSRARNELQQAKSSISSMLSQVSDIRRKAAQSELLVQEICRDIKKLDYAKTHLTSTITALRRLAMLITAVDQLQLAAERRELGDAAHLLGAVQQLSAHFKEYSHIPRVAEMRGRVSALEQALRIASLREFELLGEDPPTPALLDRLRDCCAVTAAIGAGARDELVDTVCRREMGVYTQIFGTVGETAKLERTVNRYKWLLRRLESRRDVWALFPADWRVPQIVAVAFCSMTKTALAEILDEKSNEMPHLVEQLLKAVEATHIFEAEMSRRFTTDDNTSTSTTTTHENDSTANGMPQRDLADVDADIGIDGDGRAGISRNALQEVKRRYEKPSSTANINSTDQHRQDDATPSTAYAAADAAAKARFRGSISSVFSPYLKVYVDQTQRELLWSVDQLIKSETWKALSPDQRILRSANELTDAIRNEMKECMARVSRGQILLDVAGVFGRVYEAYASKLAARLPKTQVGTTTGTPTLGVADWQVKLGDDDPELICLILTTAEHCVELVDQLARTLSTRIEPPFNDKIDFFEQEEAFRSIAVSCVSILILGTETKLETPLGVLMRHTWANVEVAGDQSEYMLSIRSILTDIGLKIGPALPHNHFRFLCDKLLRSFSPRLLESIFRCRQISHAGCQQLRLDVEALKGIFIQLAKAGCRGSGSAAAAAVAASSSSSSGLVSESVPAGKIHTENTSSAHAMTADGEYANENHHNDGSSFSSWIQSFTSDVHAQLSHIESVLKVVSSPTAALVDTFVELLPEASPSEFQRIADLKGLKRQELKAVLEEYGRRRAGVAPHRHRALGAGRGSIAAGDAHLVSTRQGTRLQVGTAQLPYASSSAAAASSLPLSPSSLAKQQASTMGMNAVNSDVLPPVPSSVSDGAAAGGGSGSGSQQQSQFRFNANLQAAKANAVAAEMRESMGRTFGAMKTRFLQRDSYSNDE